MRLRALCLASTLSLAVAGLASPITATSASAAPPGAALVTGSVTADTPSPHPSFGAPDAKGARAASGTVQDGPHSPLGRRRAPTQVMTYAGVTVRDVDLGDADLGPAKNPGAYRTPVRGILVTPAKATGPAPLVVFSHLRMPGCSDDSLTFPCPAGSKQMRYDRGMTYLAQALARRGYAVLVPDLAPLWSGGLLDDPYDQLGGWFRTVEPLRDAVMAANAGQSTAFGPGLKGTIDGKRTSLIVHSRSGYVQSLVPQRWARSSTPIVSVMAYGGAYSTPDENNRFTAPPPANIPFLGIVGDADQDVELAGSVWAAEHVVLPRTAPALEVVVPGFGHTYVNRALSAIGRDDRIEPPKEITAARHERLLTTAATAWLDQTVRRKPGPMPLTATATLPATLDGNPARWLAATNTTRTG